MSKHHVAYSFINPETGTVNDKHLAFYMEVMKSAAGKSNKRIFFFGGGIRGGKTYTCLLCIIRIARNYPGTRIHIIRDSMPSLKSTVEPSLLKLAGGLLTPHRSPADYYFEMDNGSRIYFFPESFDADKDLDRFKGLETNVIFLEQIEGLNEKTFQKAQERMGTYRFRHEPHPIILSTFNPTHVKWIRDLVYLPYKSGKLEKSHYVQMVTAADNPFVAQFQWEAWEGMDKMHYEQYVNGDWDVFQNVKAYMYGFDVAKHVKPVPKQDSDIYISFDFNVDPSVALLGYVGDNYLHIYKELRINNSNIYELCEKIKQEVGLNNVFITGDAAGRSRSHTIKDNMNTYDLIRKLLIVPNNNIHVPNRNLGLRDSRQLCNLALDAFDIRVDPSCEYLIQDLLTVEVDEKGLINKKQDKEKTHLLDCFRYYISTYFFKKLSKHLLLEI
jgi:hypothetical protein